MGSSGSAGVVAAVLAAGRSRRFGAADKLAAPLAGRPLLAHALDPLRGARGIERIVVVVGPGGRLPPGLDSGDLEVVRCARAREGISASLRCAIDAADPNDVLITLGDQPFIKSATVEAVLAAGAGPSPAARAVYDGRPGHPVLIKRELFDAVRALRDDRGARELLNGVATESVPCPGGRAHLDVDTPDDLTRASD